MPWRTTNTPDVDDILPLLDLDLPGAPKHNPAVIRSLLHMMQGGREKTNREPVWPTVVEAKILRYITLALRYHGWTIEEVHKLALPGLTRKRVEMFYQQALREEAERGLREDGATALGAWAVAKLQSYAEAAEEEGDFETAAKYVSKVADIVKRRPGRPATTPQSPVAVFVGAELDRQIERALASREPKALEAGEVEVVDVGRPQEEREDKGDDESSGRREAEEDREA